MRESKYLFYRNSLQGHPSIARTDKADPEAYKFLGKYLKEGGRILAIGCADGSEVMGLKLAGYDSIGVTLGNNNVKYARSHFPDVETKEMDFHDLDFSSCSFDGIYSSHSFEHCFAPMLAVMEAWTVLKKNGFWYMRHPFFNPTAKETHNVSYHHPNVNTPEWHRNLFEACSFEVIEYERIGSEDRWWLQKKVWGKDVHSSIKECLDNRKNKSF